jgi:solute carrier family 9B (sodium/hydrogen exchanger), member 1/2
MSLNTLFVLILLGGWLSGKLSEKLGLPSVLGMTLWGITLSYFFKDNIPSGLWESAPFLRSLALIIILLRAGLGIEKETLSKVGPASIRIAFIPCLLEGAAVTFASRYFLNFSWPESGMMGFILAAVSPAVVVPAMLKLKEKGYGKKNETPTLILAGASLDDVTSITIFTIFLNLFLGTNVNYVMSAISVPLAIAGGLTCGLASGVLFSWLFKKYFKQIRATEKMLLILGFSVILLQVGTTLHVAALLSVMTMGFVLLEKSEKAAHELASKLSKIWIFAEIVLFVLVGMAVNPGAALESGLKGFAIIGFGVFFRSIGVLVSLFKTKFSVKERSFCVISYIPKATVQAALGAVPLLCGAPNGEVILSIAVLSICLTAPIGLLGMKYSAPKLLDLSLER